jgi:hypothetical protein
MAAMSTPQIILAHAADSNALAGAVNRRLVRLGYGVEQRLIGASGRLREDLGQAQRLIVLWSRGAASANPQLRRAEQAGKLSVIRLASAPTPARLKRAARKLPRPGDGDAAWRGLTENAATLAPRAKERGRYGLLALALVALVAALAGAAALVGPLLK